MMIKRYLLLSVIIYIMVGCAPQRHNPFSKSYHHITAYYNAYYIAREKLGALENEIYKKEKRTYDLIFPVFPPYDSVQAKANAAITTDCIKKTSLAIQYHPGSAWEDENYLELGKARFFGYEWDDAIETFKYINVNSQEEATKHEALIWLMRTFLANNEFQNALAVSEFLKKEKLNKSNASQLYLVRAALYQSMNEPDKVVSNLILAEPEINNPLQRARINYLIGQLYQQLGFDSHAYFYYLNVLKHRPGYELGFYTKLSLSQVSAEVKKSDQKKVIRNFEKMAKDPKNVEYLDKIYYDQARFELKRGNADQALIHFDQSLRVPNGNPRQKGLTYLALATYYYDSLQDFETAKNYYDSTSQALPKTEKGYDAIVKRKEVLDRFVQLLAVIRLNDSLLALMTYSDLQMDSLVETIVAQKKAAQALLKQSAKKKKKSVFSESTANVGAFTNTPSLISTQTEGSAVWYFYNPTVVAQGANEFKRVWGNIANVDYWRVSSLAKVAVTLPDSQAVVPKNPENINGDVEVTEDEIDPAQIKQDILASLPADSATLATVLKNTEDAQYALAQIYAQELDEPENAIAMYQTVLKRFPATAQKPEILYRLYLLTQETQYADVLTLDYPDHIYAKLIQNPRYREDSQAETDLMEKYYEQAYRFYDIQHYDDALKIIADAQLRYPENEYVPYFLVLKAKILALTATTADYQMALHMFLFQYPKHSLTDHVLALLEAAVQKQLAHINSTAPQYAVHSNQPHYMVLQFSPSASKLSLLAHSLSEFTAMEQYTPLTISSVVLKDDVQLMVLQSFANETECLAALQKYFLRANVRKIYGGSDLKEWIISASNFYELYQTKTLEEYLTFYHQQYQSKLQQTP